MDRNMSSEQSKRGLGRGLSALMADLDAPHAAAPNAAEAGDGRGQSSLPIERVHPNPDQPRRDFSRDDLEDLASSIAEKGIIQPLIVRPDPTRAGDYQIVAGERRWRAAQIAKLHRVPVLIRDLDDMAVLEIAIIENVQRADLNVVEEALGYRQLMDKFGHTQEKMSAALGKSRSHIANILRLLALPKEVQALLRDGSLTYGHARALITAEDPMSLARVVIGKGLSVRQTEALAKSGLTKPKRERTQSGKDSDTRALEADLSANLGMKVSIDHRMGAESGQISIAYKTLDELDDLCRLLSAMGPDETT
jgi:ParB family chromosome partitioning protein